MRTLLILLLACPLTFWAAPLPRIVAFLGTKHVGKDTSADYLVEEYGYHKYALADPMKVALQQLFHFSQEQLWGEEKDQVDPYWEVTPREVMQYIGVDTLFYGLGERFPHLGNTFYLRSLEKWLEDNPKGRVAICDLRLQEDVLALKEMGALIIRLDRPQVITNDIHMSEANVAHVEGYDLIIKNDGTIIELERNIDHAIHAYIR